MDNIPAPILPLELQYVILEEIADNRASLAACGLVCRAWRYQTRAHLFRTVIFVLFSSYARFLAICEASPEVAHHVRVARFRGNLVGISFIIRLLTKTPNVTSLSLENLDAKGLHHARFCSFSFPRIQRLTMKTVTLTEEQFVTILCRCQELKELRLRDLDLLPSTQSSSTHPPVRTALEGYPSSNAPVMLKCMYFHSSRNHASIFHALERVPVQLHLQELHIVWTHWSTVDAQRILRGAGANLQSLNITPALAWHNRAEFHSFDLAQNLNITELHLKDFSLSVKAEHSQFMRGGLRWIPAILMDVRPHHKCLRRVQFSIRIRLSDLVSQAESSFLIGLWTALDPALAPITSHHPGLLVIFNLCSETKHDRWMQPAISMLKHHLLRSRKGSSKIVVRCYQGRNPHSQNLLGDTPYQEFLMHQ
ncbi:uncharacterized protein LAESUDRAFT_323572 [Laetiporus sulphureus 93-53]|uniref:F-box domain-containing protein n=1 Tax=Laetiporus sulphureus 93-53 TaxID=1314785 RepID=A0A165CYC5_9APHY|nr:uncharacterized protein LAESUDRAFT_323572 [Laetiporus sulphureus 93-53]KZT03739.1 hypothetical protein LAESUDRAFT_323572 [Laetiporus sulphureus 93-53]